MDQSYWRRRGYTPLEMLEDDILPVSSQLVETGAHQWRRNCGSSSALLGLLRQRPDKDSEGPPSMKSTMPKRSLTSLSCIMMRSDSDHSAERSADGTEDSLWFSNFGSYATLPDVCNPSDDSNSMEESTEANRLTSGITRLAPLRRKVRKYARKILRKRPRPNSRPSQTSNRTHSATLIRT